VTHGDNTRNPPSQLTMDHTKRNHNILGCHAIKLLFSLVQSFLQSTYSFRCRPATMWIQL